MTAVAVENEKPVAAKRSNTCSSQANPASLFIHAEAEFEKKPCVCRSLQHQPSLIKA
jgi:hypothetical protein